MIEAKNVSYKVGPKDLVKSANVFFRAGEMVSIMGPNGAGKSTLLKLLTGALKPTEGQVYHKEKEIKEYTLESLARERAVLSQSYQLNFPITVAEIIMMGRYPYFSGEPMKEDIRVFDIVVELLGLAPMLDRDYNTLSGGEGQKVQMARVLAQVWQDKNEHPRALYLDEPVSSLDMRYQHEILEIARRFAIQGNAVITVLHDINLALQYADRIYFMKNGEILYSYAHGEILDLKMLQYIFDIRFELLTGPENRQFLVPLTNV